MSQSHWGNYMDGVPVKISEKYKPPPRIALPSGLLEKINSYSESVESISYDFSLENNVLKKLEEWKNAKETERNERNHRLQLREEARQRELDLIAATETEERLKQLSISEVSYPSTEEISEMSPDDGADCKPPGDDGSTPTRGLDEAEKVPVASSENYAENMADNVYQFGAHVPSSFATNKYLEKTKYESNSDILQPTPVSPNRIYAPTNLLDDPDPIKQLQKSIQNKSQSKSFRHKPFYIQNNIDNLTFSDFENDTSSPFDNMELKTMNDIELLAQVLTSHQSTLNSQVVEPDNMVTDSFPNQSMCDPNSVSMYSNTHSTAAGADVYSHNLIYSHNPHPGIDKTYSGIMNCVPMTNGYYDNTGGKVTSYTTNVGMSNVNGYYSPEYGYTMANPGYQQVNPTYNQPINEGYTYSKPSEQNTVNSDSYQREQNVSYNHTVKNVYDYYKMDYPGYPQMNYAQYPHVTHTTQKLEDEKDDDSEFLKLSKSRSRSVPDIVKELDNEVAGSRLRSRERSHNSSPAPSNPAYRPVPSTSQSLRQENLSNPFDNLSQTLQLKCKRISGMGFPLDRVSRACEGFGQDDKKMIEYLLAMGELMDLGFPESRVSKALLQNNCNRDKALDELLS